MGWKEDNKGAGPWLFAKQANKWGYVNNPRWMEPPSTPISYDGREDEEPQVWDMTRNPIVGRSDAGPNHRPCGHWHQPVSTPPPIYDVNLFRVTDPWLAYGSVQSLFFNTTLKTLSLVNYYVDSPGVCAIEVIGNRVYTIKGRYDTAQLLELDRFLNVTNTYNIFNYYDCTGPRNYHLHYYNGSLYWSSEDGGQPSVVGRISVPSFTRSGRFSPGGVFVGSDGNLYQFDYYSSRWGDAIFYPITGTPVFYNAANNLIADNDHDGDIVAWGSGTQKWTTGTNPTMIVKDGLIYYSPPVSYIGGGRIYAFDPDNFSTLYTVTPSNYSNSLHKSSNGYFYSSSGTFDWFKIARFSSSLSSINDVIYYNYGRVFYSYQICDLGNYIVVGTVIYGTGDYGIVLLNSDLSLVRFISTKSLGHNDAQCVISYNNFLFVGENNHVSAFELIGDNLVFLDRIYVDWSPIADVGFRSKWMKYMLVPR